MIAPTTFTPKVYNISKTMLPLESYPRLVLPAGMLTVWEPKIIGHDELQLQAGYTPKTSTGSVYGLTEPAFSVTFEKPGTQWAKDNSGMWQFQGGNVVIECGLLIYVSARFEGQTYRNDGVALVMTHELKHWQDNIDIVTNWLPAQLKVHKDIKRLLIDDGTGKPACLSQTEYDKWITKVNPDTGGYKWEDTIIDDVYAPERDRRDRLRDTAAEYEVYSRNIGLLRQKKPELVVWPK